MATRAMHMFLAQTWTNKELVILDDATDRSFEVAPCFPGIVYLVADPTVIGERRNQAIRASGGEIIITWDSDDLYHPERIEHQANLLIANPRIDIVGYREVDFQNIETGERWRFYGSGRPIGVSLCYWRRIWEERQFKAVNVQEEYSFMDGRRLLIVDAENRLVATTHSGNTSPRDCPERHPAQWRLVA